MTIKRKEYPVGLYISKDKRNLCIFFTFDSPCTEGYCFKDKQWSTDWAIFCFEEYYEQE